MALQMKRIVLFTPNVPAMTAFYRDVIGLKIKTEEKGWVELDAGGCAIALHNGTSAIGRRAPKIVFYAKDVTAVRAELVARGAKLGKVRLSPALHSCDGKDPDGNYYGISNRI